MQANGRLLSGVSRQLTPPLSCMLFVLFFFNGTSLLLSSTVLECQRQSRRKVTTEKPKITEKAPGECEWNGSLLIGII